MILSLSLSLYQLRAARLKELRVQRDVQRRKEMEKRMEQERMLEAKPSTK